MPVKTLKRWLLIHQYVVAALGTACVFLLFLLVASLSTTPAQVKRIVERNGSEVRAFREKYDADLSRILKQLQAVQSRLEEINAKEKSC